MLAGGLILLWRAQTSRTSQGMAAPAVTAAPPTSAPARQQEASSDTEYEEAPLPHVVSDGFCGAPEMHERFQIRYTLADLIDEESEGRLASLSYDARDQVIRAARDFLSTGRVPDAVSAVDVLLVSAREKWSPERMLARAEQVLERVPSDPYLEVMRARAALRLGLGDVELEALRKARLGLPKSPAVGVQLALRLLDTAALDEAVAGLDTYLAADRDPVLSRLRARLVVAADIHRDYARKTRDGVTLLWPSTAFDESRADLILRSIAETLDSSSRRLGLPRRTTLFAVAYPGRSELLAVTCSPSWAGGVYDGTLRLVVPPEKSADRLLIDVRHEATHAVLSPAAHGAPQWFHEGIAQLFAGDPIPHDLWRAMARNKTWIPFESLDGSFHIFEKGSDAALAYAEGRALVELMQSRGGDAALARAAQEFHQGTKTIEVLAHATGQQSVTGQDLLAFLAQRLGDPERR